jgi:hypothetical protein
LHLAIGQWVFLKLILFDSIASSTVWSKDSSLWRWCSALCAARLAATDGLGALSCHAHVLSGRSSETTITAEPSKELCVFCQVYEAAACKSGERTQVVLQLKHIDIFIMIRLHF